MPDNQQPGAVALQDKPYAIAFSRVPGVGVVRMHALAARFGSLRAAWLARDSEISVAGLPDSVAAEIVRRRRDIDPEAELGLLAAAGASALVPGEAGFPDALLRAPAPPAVVYCRGTLSDADSLAIAIVGTRKPTRYGLEVARGIAEDLARARVTVVSGLALGIDAAAHDAALRAGGRTLAVLGSGVDVIYPSSHRLLAERVVESGALVSEYPLGTRPDARNFPPRNRIISGLSRGVLVVEAGDRSGALITAQFALDQNRDTYAVPGAVTWPNSRGTNRLIQNGEAKLVTCAEDILVEMHLPLAAAQADVRAATPIGGFEARLMGMLGVEPMHADELCRATGLPMAIVSSTLTMLELKGIVHPAGGMSYAIVHDRPATYRAPGTPDDSTDVS
jgi:DNA processing protein